MKCFIILIGKILVFLLEKIGKGSSFPGYIVRKLDPQILNKFELPKTVIAVTGSSGKSSISYMIYKVLHESGFQVAHNSKGSNLIDGVLSLLLKHSCLNGKSKADYLVLEVDERYTKQIFKVIQPTHIVLSNITRDQPPRHGDYTTVYQVIDQAIPSNSKLIVNADDPIITTLVSNKKGKKIYYGMCQNWESYDHLVSSCLDMVYCPYCHHKLEYHYVQFGNVGDYYCNHCDFKRPALDYNITKRDKNSITINHQYQIGTSYQMLYLSYNVLAAFSCLATLGISKDTISEHLNQIKLLNQRYEEMNINGRKCQVITGKNENAISYNQAINYVRNKKERKTIVFGFEYISKRYSYQDISWLYDIDFEFLDHVDSFICIGPFAADIASRISITDMDKKNIILVKDIKEISKAIKITKGNIYAILNMGMEQQFIEYLKQN